MRLTIEKILVLRQVPLFKNMRENALSDMLRLGTEIEATAGEQLLKQGDIVDSLYVVLQGSINVHKESKIINSLKPHDYWGILFAFDASKTQYSFTASEDSIVFKINGDGLYDLISSYKDFASNLMMIMCQRVKEKDKWVNL